MRKRAHRILTALLAMAVSCATAKEQPQKAPTLPSVLIIGDEVYQQIVRGAASEFKSIANVVIPKWPTHLLLNSTNAIEQIDLLLGYKDLAGNEVPEAKRPKWDLIHFNVGLGDLIHRVPGLKSHRSLPHDFGGVITTTPEQYEKNLDALIHLLKRNAPKAKIIWANTTPIPASNDNWFRAGSEVEYNQIAERVMKKHGIPVNDMHAYVVGVMEDVKPPITDPFNFGKKLLHPQVVASISHELTGK